MAKKLLMGNEAMAHAALEAGVGVAAGYPGTPSSEIIETIGRMVRRGAARGVHVEWSTNEKAALELLYGASLAGKRSLFVCKQMGLNVAADALLSLNYVGTRGGLVLIVADDPGPISSQTEQDTRRFAAFAKVPVFDPANLQQAFTMTKLAFEVSERFGTPVIVRPTTRIDHTRTFFDVEETTTAKAALDALDSASEKGFMPDPQRLVIFPKRSYEAHQEINQRLKDLENLFSTEEPYAGFNSSFDRPAESNSKPALDASREMRSSAHGGSSLSSFGVIASGVSYAYAREAIDIVATHASENHIPMPAFRFMQLGTPHPFPRQKVQGFLEGLSDVLVLEELDCVVEDEVARLAGLSHLPITLHGKLSGEVRECGENSVDDIATRLEKFFGLTGRLSLARVRAHSLDDADSSSATAVAASDAYAKTIRWDASDIKDLPSRPPVLCAGCPHRGTLYATKSALGNTPAVLCGDIGCYTLGNAAPLSALDTCLCMGAGVTMAQGIAVADPDKKAVAYIGDSTLFASGLPGLANAAYNNHDITVIVLDNETTAMTGAQPHPGTGNTLMGGQNAPLDIKDILITNGFKRVFDANPLDYDSSVVAVRAALSHTGPSAVIFKSPCAQLIPPDEPVAVNPDVCTGCKQCIDSIGCPAITFNEDAEGPRSRGKGQAQIDTSLCVGCTLCTQVCPFKAIVPQRALSTSDTSESGALPVVEEDELEPMDDAIDTQNEAQSTEAQGGEASGEIQGEEACVEETQDETPSADQDDRTQENAQGDEL